MSACLIGSGTLLNEHATVSCMAVAREILCPMEMYTGLEASLEVSNAWRQQHQEKDKWVIINGGGG